MKKFSYKAKDKKTGDIIRGTVQAETENAAGKLLVEQGLIPEKLTEENKNSIFFKLKNQVKSKDRIVFTRQFATLIGAGLPLAGCLRTLVEQTDAPAMKAVASDILTNVEAGKSLSESLKMHPEVFNNVYLSLVAAGEVSGTLDSSLAQLATQDEKDAAMISAIKSALIYPAILLVVIIFVVFFMIFSVVPEVQNLYASMDEELPALTVFFVALVESLTTTWFVYIIVAVMLVVAFMQFKKTRTGEMLFAKLKLNIPMFKGLFQRLYMTRFAKTMQVLLQTGVSMLDSMNIASKATANLAVEEVIMKARDKVKSGKPLSESLSKQPYILPLVPQMASIGEESGKIDEMLGRAGQIYENELDEKIKNISTLIEPILLLIMAGMVGLVLAGTLLPIYSLVSSI